MFTGPVRPVEVFVYWPEAVLGNFYWPGAIGSPLASSPVYKKTLSKVISLWEIWISIFIACIGIQGHSCTLDLKWRPLQFV